MTAHDYSREDIKVLDARIVGITHARYGRQLWVLMGVPIRKPQECTICEQRFGPGSTKMFRPVTNGYNRMERICQRCITELVGVGDGDEAR